MEDRHRDILKAFYSVFKLADADREFVLLTGGDQVFAGERVQRFQPVHRYQHERGLRGDLRHHSGGAGAIFAGPVTQLAQSEECSREEMLARLKDMYDACPFLIGKMRLSGILPVLPASCFSPRLDVARYAFG